jgi:replicative DNA helicase
VTWAQSAKRGEGDEAFMERYTALKGCLRKVANMAEVIIAKQQRMGPISVEKLSFNPELTRFTHL